MGCFVIQSRRRHEPRSDEMPQDGEGTQDCRISVRESVSNHAGWTDPREWDAGFQPVVPILSSFAVLRHLAASRLRASGGSGWQSFFGELL